MPFSRISTQGFYSFADLTQFCFPMITDVSLDYPTDTESDRRSDKTPGPATGSQPAIASPG
jgi:hypothetical protein